MSSYGNSFNTLTILPTSFPIRNVAEAIIPLLVSLPMWINFYTGIAKYNDFLQARTWRQQDPNFHEEFDFIVVGGGSSGSVVANRLSEHNTVLLLELGGNPIPLARLGLSYYALQRVPGLDLLYETVPQKNAALAMHNQVVFYPRGTGLGGSSNLNAMIYQRGNPKDYDNWANITEDPAWSYSNVLPYFKKLEDYHGDFPSDKFHGKGGPIHVEKVKYSLMEKYFLDAAKEKGYQIKDPTANQTIGFSPNEVTMKDGLRWDTYNGYIKPIESRKNLKIYRYSRVIKVHLDKNRHAYGVTFFRHGHYRFVKAKKEIILSAGAIDTPKILILSGIGPMDHLNSLDLKCLLDLPVGQNLQDHTMTLFGPILVDTPESLLFSRALNLRSVFDFATMRSGPVATTTQGAIGFVSSSVRKDDNWPDIQITHVSLGIISGLTEFYEHLFNVKSEIYKKYIQDENENVRSEVDANILGISLQRPKGRGYVKLASRDPFVPPLIQPNYLSHPDDVRALVEGMKIALDIFENTTVYRRINARLIKPFPGCEETIFKSDAYYECFLRQITTTIYHPVGTAAMGKDVNDKRAVVDSKLRVLNTSGLRVIDASIMPVIPNGNTNIPSIMIGEVGSDFIINHWKNQFEVSNLPTHLMYPEHDIVSTQNLILAE